MPIFNAPSGLTAELRKLRGAELIAVAEADGAGTDGGFGTMVGPCWLQTLSAGPYPHVSVGDLKPDWTKLLKGDVLAALVHLRRISMPDGDNYDFDVRCEECGKRYGWRLNLAELPVKLLPEESARRMRASEPHEARLGDGRRVLFHLATLAQEGPIAQLLKRQKRRASTLVDLLAAQSVSVEGCNPDLAARHRLLSDLDVGDLYALRDAFDRADCGIDTAIQTKCTSRACGWEQDIDLPLGRGFLAPPRRRREAPSTEPSSGASSPGPTSATPSTSPTSASSSTASSGSSTGAAATG